VVLLLSLIESGDNGGKIVLPDGDGSKKILV
jgi:hypothetical protein